MASYETEKYLIYDFKAGVFAPHPSLNDDDKQDVKDMIETLGINCIYDQRRTRLKEWRFGGTKVTTSLNVVQS